MDEVRLTGYYDSGKNYGIQVRCTAVPDVQTNTSTVTVDVYLIHPYMNISARTGSVSIDGTAYSFKTAAIKDSDVGLVATKSKKVTHNDDGKMEISVAASFPFDLNSSSYGRIRTAKVSGKITLDMIPRSSEIITQAANVVVNGENAWTATLLKHAESFRHKITMRLQTDGGAAGYMGNDVFDTDISFTIPADWLEVMPTQTIATVDVTIQTYSDSTLETMIGDPITTAFTVSVPDDAAPVLSEGWASIVAYNDGTDADGMTAFVQGYSRARAMYDVSKVTLKYGANSVRFRTEWNGEPGAAYNITGTLTGTGKQRIRCIAIDSRGLESYEDIEISVCEYFIPTLTDISIYRCDSNGNADDAGTNLYFKAACNYADCGGENNVSIKVAYKLVMQGVWTNDTDIISGVASILGSGALSPTASYNARIVATDRLGGKVLYSTTVSTADAAFNLKDGGKGGAFGKYAEEDDLLDCNWRFRARGGICGSSIYTDAEDEHGVMGSTKVYQRMFSKAVEGGTATLVGTIAGFKALIFAHGAAGNSALQSVSVDDSGNVYATSLISGEAYVIIGYTKEG